MRFYSTNNREHVVDARTAVLSGLAPDGGLYMPEIIPRLPEKFFQALPRTSLQEIGFEVASVFLSDVVPPQKLREIVDDALNFSIPLVPIAPAPNARSSISVLELFHGPTLAFKDVGARFMARLMSYFVRDERRELTILVATSGDTGSAVASGFYRVPGIRVVVLYPRGRISKLQEAQMTTLGENIMALEVDGVFDDCQRLVKEAFVDQELRERLWLSSANSINIARLIPQTFYYFWAVAQAMRLCPDLSTEALAKVDRVTGDTVISVPSGNFGNLTAGLMAKRMGLPIDKFIAATNVNDVVPEYLETAIFRPRPSIATMSNAMDVGNPSNFARMHELYPTIESMREDVIGIRVSEEETRAAMAEMWEREGYQLDPHGAVAFSAATRFLKRRLGLNPAQVCCLETAHPAKFPTVVEEVTGKEIPLPERLASCMNKEEKSTRISSHLEDVKRVLFR
jgi:threonine synthase